MLGDPKMQNDDEKNPKSGSLLKAFKSFQNIYFRANCFLIYFLEPKLPQALVLVGLFFYSHFPPMCAHLSFRNSSLKTFFSGKRLDYIFSFNKNLTSKVALSKATNITILRIV